MDLAANSAPIATTWREPGLPVAQEMARLGASAVMGVVAGIRGALSPPHKCLTEFIIVVKAMAPIVPAGVDFCCKNTTLQNASSNNMNTWKRTRHYDASTLIEVKKLANIQCSKNHPRKSRILGNTCISNKIVAKPTARPVKKDCGCWLGLKIRGSLGYTRINHPKCPSTKASEMPVSAGEAVQKKKGAAIECNCPPHCPTPSESLTLPPEDVLYIRPVIGEDGFIVRFIAPQMFSLVPGRRYKVINTTTIDLIMTWTGAGPAYMIRDCDKLGAIAAKSWTWLKIPKQTCPRPSYCLTDESGRIVEFKDERTTIYLTGPLNRGPGLPIWRVTPCSAGYLFKKPVGNKGHCHSSEEVPCPTFPAAWGTAPSPPPSGKYKGILGCWNNCDVSGAHCCSGAPSCPYEGSMVWQNPYNGLWEKCTYQCSKSKKPCSSNSDCLDDEGECVTVNPAGCQFENPKNVTDACGNTFKQCLGEVQRLKKVGVGGQAFPIKWVTSTGGLFETAVPVDGREELVAACANDSVCGQATGGGFLTCCNEELKPGDNLKCCSCDQTSAEFMKTMDKDGNLVSCFSPPCSSASRCWAL